MHGQVDQIEFLHDISTVLVVLCAAGAVGNAIAAVVWWRRGGDRGRAALPVGDPDLGVHVTGLDQDVCLAARAFRPIEKVLVAYDGGRSAMKAVDHIARSPLFAGLDVTELVHEKGFAVSRV